MTLKLAAITLLSSLVAAALISCTSDPLPAPTATSQATVPTSTAMPTPTETLRPLVRLNAVGDVMLERDVIRLMGEHGNLYPYEAVLPALAAADITIANLEGTFTERGQQQAKLYTFRTPIRFAEGLREAGIDIVSLGNNHTLDYGIQGLTDTLTTLDASGVLYSGAGLNEIDARRPAVIEKNGLRFAFLSYNGVQEDTFAGANSPGVALASQESITQDVIAAKAGAGHVIVSLHAGPEYTDSPTDQQRSLARATIDAGATLVLGHHPHVLQGWERYNRGLIVYSLGNFIFDLDLDDLASLGPRPF